MVFPEPSERAVGCKQVEAKVQVFTQRVQVSRWYVDGPRRPRQSPKDMSAFECAAMYAVAEGGRKVDNNAGNRLSLLCIAAAGESFSAFIFKPQ